MGLERGHGLDGCGLIDGELIDIHRSAIALAQDIDCASVGTDHRASVLAGMVGEVGVLACGGVILPDFARHTAGVVLAPGVLHALLVLIDHEASLAVPFELLGRCAQHLCRASAGDRHFIDLGKPRAGKEHTAGRILDCGRKIDIFTVGAESPRQLAGRVGGQTRGCTTCRGHDIDIKVALSVAGEGQITSVSTPHGVHLIARLCGELHGVSAVCRHFVDVALVAESDFLSVGRDGRIAHP